MREGRKTVVYAIDRHDILIEVDSNWTHFAKENEGASTLNPSSVIGTSLWNHIRDKTLQAIYRPMIDSVRRSASQSTFDFRCDSPSFRRRMRMTLSGKPNGDVIFESETIKVEPREEGVSVAAAYKGNQHLIRCSICNLFRLPDGDWSEVQGLVESSDFMSCDRQPKTIWTVCEQCRSGLTTAAKGND